jgi:hypothetical protein
MRRAASYQGRLGGLSELKAFVDRLRLNGLRRLKRSIRGSTFGGAAGLSVLAHSLRATCHVACNCGGSAANVFNALQKAL